MRVAIAHMCPNGSVSPPILSPQKASITGIVAVAPVSEVVAALGVRSGVVADLIGRQARRRRPLLGQLEQLR